jgi:two-component system cell cycle response regulator DivK
MHTILVADDHDDIRRVLTIRLERSGFTVIAARNGLEAIDLASNSTPALILMDLNMPGLDGLEATLRLKREPHLATVPIIALTAYALPGDQSRAICAGCDDFHAKPFDFELLLSQIQRLINASR